ncbi:MAG: hypothetical protein C4583_04395 [Anaerolineaceae bacterium]|nr:MAG: hypothetical protein C4583_04395 [Anaerolineaceae bacterium]
MDRIIQAKDYAQREGARSVVERIARLSAQMVRRRLLDTPFVGGAPAGTPVLAEVGDGQWRARCECGGLEAVDVDEPIFYCFNCGNFKTKGRPRAVVFPPREMMEEIERLLLDRPMIEAGGTNEIDRMLMKLPALAGMVDGAPVVMRRSWKHDETVDDLRRQNGMMEALEKAGPTPDPSPNERASFGEGNTQKEGE